MSVDVLLLTALPEEYDALIAAAERKAPDFPGVAEWRQVAGNMPYAVGDFHTGGGDVISMAVAKPTRMGGAAMGRLAAYLTNELRPGCLAMSGVYAGNPDRVALGDVVVA